MKNKNKLTRLHLEEVSGGLETPTFLSKARFTKLQPMIDIDLDKSLD